MTSSENPFHPPSQGSVRASSPKERPSIKKSLLLTAFAFAVVTGVSAYVGASTQNSFWISMCTFFYVGSPVLALIATFAAVESRFENFNNREAIKRGFGFAFLVLAALIIGYVVFAGSCIGTNIVLMDIFPGPPRTYAPAIMPLAIVSTLATLLGCVVTGSLHMLLRGKRT